MADLVNATSDMLRAFDDVPKTVRAIAAVENDKVLGVAGFYPYDGKLVMFSGIADDARAEIGRHKRTLIKCARKIMGMAAEKRMPIYAEADPNIPGSASLLSHLGFSPTNIKDIYRWGG